MRKTILIATTAFVVGGFATGAVLSNAQPAPPPAAAADGTPPPAHGWMGGSGHWMNRHMGWHHPPHGGPMEFARTFALIYRQQDRALAPADVQKIVEGFLLWNGNHSWKVSAPVANPDGLISFSLTTPEGSVIAKFTMDPHSAKVHRVG